MIKKGLKVLLLLLPAVIMVLPIGILLSGSMMDSYEILEELKPLLSKTETYIFWRWIPQYPTFENYGKLLFLSPEFYVLFWNSIFMTGSILLGQLLIGVPAAWAFAVYQNKKSRGLFAVYIVLMLIPFQVTMLSSYLVLNRLHLLNTYGAVILPAVFSTFPIFLSYGGFCEIPEELLDAARLDGAGELEFLEYWNLMEQPMAFLENAALWPLSLYLPQITLSRAGFAFSASVITLIPSVFVFAFGQDYLEQGIIYSGLKC